MKKFLKILGYASCAYLMFCVFMFIGLVFGGWELKGTTSGDILAFALNNYIFDLVCIFFALITVFGVIDRAFEKRRRQKLDAV